MGPPGVPACYLRIVHTPIPGSTRCTGIQAALGAIQHGVTAAGGDRRAACPGGAAVQLSLTWRWLSTWWLVPGGMPPLPFPPEMQQSWRQYCLARVAALVSLRTGGWTLRFFLWED